MTKNDSEETKTNIEAFLSLPSLMTIVSSSVEVFRKEAIGYLVGIRSENKFIVEYAIPYQTAEATATHAVIDDKRIIRINEILQRLSQQLEYIGDFHSHTEYGESPGKVIPSDEDLQSTIPGDLNLICAVNEKKRAVDWHETSSDTIAGTVGEYHIEIGGYYVDKPHIGRKYNRVIVRCPFVTGIDHT